MLQRLSEKTYPFKVADGDTPCGQVEKDGLKIALATYALRSDVDVALAAVKQNGSSHDGMHLRLITPE